MRHLIATGLSLAWIAVNLYLWETLDSQLLLFPVSLALGAGYFLAFWLFMERS